MPVTNNLAKCVRPDNQHQIAPQDAKGRDQEGDRQGAQGPDIGDQPEVDQIGEGGADEADRQHAGPHLGEGPVDGGACHQGVTEEGEQEEAGAELAAKGHQLGVEAAPLADPAPGQETGAAIAGGGDEAGQTTYDKTLTWALLGAGGMVTSVEDLAVWFAALHSGAILPPEQPNLVFSAANERWLLGSFAKLEVNGEAIVQMGGSTDYGYTALLQFVPARDLLIILLFNAHDSKYGNATHHRISRHHILPILLADSAD